MRPSIRLAFLILVALCATSAPAKGEGNDAKPNLLVITIDTLRADHLGSYGYAPARTPAIDQLAREGVRFDRAFTVAPLTLPAHCSLFTGTYPLFHGVRDNSAFVLPPQRTTLAEILKAQGYRTGAFVGAFVLDSKFGLDQGFDTYYDDFDLALFETVSPGYVQRPANEVVSKALEWLASEDGGPFFLWVHLYDPHDPYTPPEPFASRHPGRPYDGEIEFADSNVGRLLDWLAAKGLRDKTLIALAGDHGESLGEHGEEKHGLFVYNATLRVPLILRLPDGSGAGRVIADNVSLIDLAPTLLQLLKADRGLAGEMQGRGLAGAVLGKGRIQDADLYAESYYPNLQFGWSPLRTLISGAQKYILAPRPELYDLAGDFAESHDQAAQNQALAGRLRENLDALTTRFANRSAGAESESRPDSETLEKLQSLGYVSLSAGKVTEGDYRTLPDPKEQIGLYNRLTRLFELSSQGKHREAIPGYQEAVRQQPSLKIAWYKLGQAYFAVGEYAEALEKFQKAIELGGEDALATFDLAQTYLRLNRPQDAVVGFQRTLQLDPNHYRARTNLGVLYKNQGKIPEAIAELEKAIETAPGSAFAQGNLGVCYAIAGRNEEGVQALQKAIALAPGNALLHANLATVYQKMGKTEEAQKELETARRLNPKLFRR